MTFRQSGILFFLLAMSLPAACRTSPDCFDPKVFCAALVTDTQGLDDNGFRQDAWNGLNQSRQEKILDFVASIESVDARDYEKNITYFAGNGYDVILTAGSGLRRATLNAAGLFPESIFIGIDQIHEEAGPNLIRINFPEDQMGFLAGTMAAHLSATRVVAGLCETSEFDSMWRYCEGFRAGAKYIDEDIQVMIKYREGGSQDKLFLDEAWGIEQGENMISQGADVIFGAGGVTGQGALRAATLAGILSIGTERNQAMELGAAGSSVVASVYGHPSAQIQTMLPILREGMLPPPTVGQFNVILREEFSTENLKADIDLVLSGLISGSIKTTIPFEKP
ncbi:MAG: BMP family ABC transporter substrate-binding protein [Chloroflexi bacterium]|nr:BMP family ABC transporter substrate-binding protein [Chloroflexota bacterium]